MTHFYLTLPSNSSHEYFPNNTKTEFTTKLASTIELTNEWEVGLAEIMFPRSWYTVPKAGAVIVVDCRGCDRERKSDRNWKLQHGEELPEEEDYRVEIKLRGGFYKTMEEIVQELNLTAVKAFAAADLEKTYNPPTFNYKAITRRVHVTVPPGMSMEFPDSLESILGITQEQSRMCNYTQERLTIKGELPCDLQTGINALYIYCDLLQFTHVGHIKAPLLRVVDSGEETGGVVTRYYERPRYIPLQKKNFDSIQIVIRDDLGEKIQFESGKVLLTLHFRRAQNNYLI